MDEELKNMLIKLMEGQESLRMEFKNEITKLGVKIDGEIIPKQQALFDGYKVNTEKLTEVVDNINDLRVDINNLSIKTLKSENKIIELDRKIAR